MKETLNSVIRPFDKVDRKTFLALIIIEFGMFLFLWNYTAKETMPKPYPIFTTFLEVIQTSTFIQNLVTSLSLTLKAMVYATVIAMVISYLYVVEGFKPIVLFIVKCRYLPLTGIVFIFTLMFHSGSELKLIMLLFGIVPFFVTSMVSMIASIPQEKYDLCKTLRMNRWQTLYRTIVEAKFDYVFEVIRQNFAICWLMIVMVEGLSMSEGGLGTLMIKDTRTNLVRVFSYQLTLFLLGIFFDWFLDYCRVFFFKHVKAQRELKG